MIGSLLSGATGALGFGGNIGSPAAAPSASAASGPITSGDIAPRIGSISSGGVNLSPTISVAFPNAVVGTSDDINPPSSIFAPKNFLWLFAGIVGLVVLVKLYK